MRFYQALLLLGLALALGMAARVPVAGAADGDRVRVFIELPTHVTPGDTSFLRSLGGSVRYTFATSNTISVELPSAALPALRTTPRFFHFQPVPTVFALEDSLDWGVDRIDAEVAWGGAQGGVDVSDAARSGQNVKVAVIDTGIDRDHPDLQANIVYGRNWVSTCFWIFCSLDPGAWDDLNGHGTHVAGTIAARDDGSGLIGVAPRADLYVHRVLDANGSGFLDDVIAAIESASGLNGGIKTDVISMSLGCYCNLSALQAAVDEAFQRNVLVVAAAGNCGTGGGSGCPAAGSSDTVIYPAKYDSVMAVAATCGGSNGFCSGLDARASFSSVGPDVEIAAPGALIRSTYPDNSYATLSGTSMATPHVAGVAALVKGVNPGMTAAQLRQRLQSTALDLGAAGRDTSFGYGLVDPMAALGAPTSADTTPPYVTATSPAAGTEGVSAGSSVVASFSEAMDATSIDSSSFTLQGPGGGVSGSVTYDAVTARATFQPAAALAANATYTARLSTAVKDQAGNALAAAYEWSFKTVLPCAAPTITSHSDTRPDGGGSVSFAWNIVPGASSYAVQRLGAFNIWWTLVITAAPSFTTSDLESDPNYRVFVYAGTCSPRPGPATTLDP